MVAAIGAQDAVPLGRVTYQEWAGYWPIATDDSDVATRSSPTGRWSAPNTQVR